MADACWKLLFASIMLLFLQLSILPAQAAGNSRDHFYLGATAGVYRFDSGTDLDAATAYGARLGYLFAGKDLGDTLGVEGRIDAGSARRQGDGEVEFYIARLSAIYPLVFDKSWFPYFSLGMGIAEFGEKDVAESGPLVSFGAGFEYFINGNLHVRAEAESLYSFEADDNHHAGYTVGLIYRFGKTKKIEKPPSDQDHDGVSDKNDECADTPRGTKVDEQGCALDVSDEDKDGVPAYRDKCPESPKGSMVDDSGCSVDEDRDGIPDDVDQCLGTPEGVRVNIKGCVDSDY